MATEVASYLVVIRVKKTTAKFYSLQSKTWSEIGLFIMRTLFFTLKAGQNTHL